MGTSTGSPSASPASYRALRTLVVGTMVVEAAIALFGVARAHSPRWAMPTLGFLLAELVVAALAWAVVFLVRNNAPAIPIESASEDALRVAMECFQLRTMLRLGAGSFVVFLSLGLAMVVLQGGAVIALVGGAIGELLLATYAFPRTREVRRVEALLDRKGGHCGLSTALGLTAGPAGAVQEL